MRVVTSRQMKQIEEASLRFDLTFQRLMENAGSAAAAFIRRTFQIEGRNCMVFCGTGNNGGDGFVVARKLIENGANVFVTTVGGMPRSEEAQSMLRTVELMGVPVCDFEEDSGKVLELMERADIIVDAIYGTGFHGGLPEWTKKACEAINDAIAAIVALDIPTGVECDSGNAAEGAVRADFTIAFDSFKPVHILPKAKGFCGVTECADIGIPDGARDGLEGFFGAIRTETVFESIPKRAVDSHKGDHGRLLIIAGSRRYRGAASLATLAALRSGTGLVTLAATPAVCAAAAAKLFENIYLELPENESGGVLAADAIPLLGEAAATATCVLFGCGMGNTTDTRALLEFFIRKAKRPLLIDADGINALCANINILKEATAPVVLTPHPGEMARLCGKSAAEVQEARCGAAIAFAEEHNVIVVLKGHETVIASPEAGLLINGSGNAGLAKAGSGDVLAGMIAAFLAQGLDPMAAAAAGVHLHGLAADRASLQLSQYAMLPSDLPDYLRQILLEHDR